MTWLPEIFCTVTGGSLPGRLSGISFTISVTSPSATASTGCPKPQKFSFRSRESWKVLPFVPTITQSMAKRWEISLRPYRRCADAVQLRETTIVSRRGIGNGPFLFSATHFSPFSAFRGQQRQASQYGSVQQPKALQPSLLRPGSHFCRFQHRRVFSPVPHRQECLAPVHVPGAENLQIRFSQDMRAP